MLWIYRNRTGSRHAQFTELADFAVDLDSHACLTQGTVAYKYMKNTLAFSLILCCMTGSGFAEEPAFPILRTLPRDGNQNGF